MRRRSPRGSVVALVGALAVCVAARDAEACKCPVRGTEISAPIVLEGTLQLIAEEVALRCDRALWCTSRRAPTGVRPPLWQLRTARAGYAPR